jgi:hypothetical protein
VPKIVGNKQIALSNIKTPPHFSFQKESRNLEPVSQSLVIAESSERRSINNFNSLSTKFKTFVSPGVGDYQVEKIDLRKRSPVVKIGNSPRF